MTGSKKLEMIEFTAKTVRENFDSFFQNNLKKLDNQSNVILIRIFKNFTVSGLKDRNGKTKNYPDIL